ncbi:MAG: FAD-dependent oxidoreductase [Actinomycetota bacterium]
MTHPTSHSPALTRDATHAPRLPRRTALAAGAGAGLALVLAACGSDEPDDSARQASGDSPDAPRRVIVVGAGPAGMLSAALLHRAGADVRVLEARPTHGGRIRHDLQFTDYPIPLGGEWLHAPAAELDELISGLSDERDIELVPYAADDSYGFYDGRLTTTTLGGDTGIDQKFADSSWLDVFDTYVVPWIADRMTYETEIVHIQDTGDEVVLTDAVGERHTADATVVTVPLAVLRDGRVEFDPPLPASHVQAIEDADLWGGTKVFVEFSERFWPTYLEFPDSFTPTGQRLYYDAGHGHTTSANVIGLFAVGAHAAPYQAVDAGDQLRDLVLAELDEIFDGAATAGYIQHIAQDWDAEPFARGAYLSDVADPAVPRRLSERFSDRVILAGDSYTTHDDWGAVDDAARSARDAVDFLLS